MSVRERLWGAASLASVLLAAGCNEQQLQPFFQNDTSPPSIQIVKTAGDTVDVADGLRFTVNAADNLGLKLISVDLTGGVQLQMDTLFRTAVTTASLPVAVTFPSGTTAGGWVYIIAAASDGADNTRTAQDSVFLKNEDALTVRVLNPTPGAVASPGRKLEIIIFAHQRDGVRRVWYTTTGVVQQADTLFASSPYPDTLVFTDTLDIGTASLGTFNIRGYALSAGDAIDSTELRTVTVQSVTDDRTGPVVTFEIPSRVERDDSIKVVANDHGGGVSLIGWKAFDRDGNQVGGAERPESGQFNPVSRMFPLVLTLNWDSLPQTLVVCAYAEDAASPPNYGYSGEACAPPTPAPGFAAPAAAAATGDTIVVVYGITVALPQGGRIADAVYNPRHNEILLTNIELDQLEIFQIASQSFTSAIPVGSRPLGIALWPLDTLGTNADTVVIANSGGTNLSVVSVDPAGRGEQRRHHLPNVLVETVATEIDAKNNSLKISVTTYDFSDRPQYLGMVCRPSTGSSNCAADSIYALYSTTPTPAQATLPVNYVNRGTVRWENLTSAQAQSHFFWEQAEVAPSPQSDTIQIIMDRGPSLPLDTVLSAACGITASALELAFLDTTFVRSSGNFTHGLVGEGGTGDAVLGYARAIGYNVIPGVTSATCSMTLVGVSFSGRIERDLGISPAVRVRDIVVNTAIGINAIAVNYNGLTNLIRADSIYVLDEGLRLQGLVQVSGVNPGMDLNFDHDFNARTRDSPTNRGTTKNDRLVFTATPEAEIDVFDTFYYGNVATIPIKDPVIGPLRGAQLATGEQILVGVTVNGVVIVTLPPITNSGFPIPEWGAPGN